MPKRKPEEPTWEQIKHDITEGANRDICPAGPAPAPYVECWHASRNVLFVVANKDVASMHNAILQAQADFSCDAFDRLGEPEIIPFGDDRAAFLIGGDMGVGHSWDGILDDLLHWAVALEGIDIEIRWPIGCDGATRG